MKISLILSAVLAATASVNAGQIRFGPGHNSALDIERPVRFDGHVLVRIDKPSAALMDTLINSPSDDVDIFGGDGQGNIDVLLSSRHLQLLRESFPTASVSIVNEDLQASIDAETIRLQQSALTPGKNWFQEYHRYEDIKKWYKALSEEHPDLVRYVPVIGKSHEGRDLFAIYLTSPKGIHSQKKQVYFQSQIHAREWISGATTQYVVHQFIKNYGSDPKVTQILDKIEFIIVPIVNPDGYEYTWTTDRLWRKNRRNNGGRGGYGVDLNRNWNSSWAEEGGASRSPLSDVYKGPSVASEPEVTSIVNFFLKHPRIVAGIDFHSFSQLILRPWGTSSRKCIHEPQHKRVGEGMKSVIENVHGKVYTSIPSVGLYPTTGTANDWFYDDQVAQTFGHHVYGYTLELRPRSGGLNGFILPPEEIIPTGEEIFEAMKYFAVEVTENPLD